MDVANLTTLPPTWTDEVNTTSDPQSMISLYTYPERVVVAVFFMLISIVDLVGNTVVILAVVFSKKLRTSTNVFVVSLSVADLLAGLGIPMSVIALLSPGDTWPFASEDPCFVGGLLLYISCGASLLNLACIALNRAVLIKRPLTTYRRLYTKRNLAIMVAFIWISSILVMLLPPLFDVGRFGLDKQFRSCSDVQSHPRGTTFDLIQTFTFFLVPSLLIFACYVIIFLHVRRHFQRQRVPAGQTKTTETASSSSAAEPKMEMSSSTTVSDDRRQQRISRQQIQITKNLFTAVCVFFLCVSPFFVTNISSTTSRFLLFAAIPFLCNSCANPIIYAAKHPQFKKVMRRLLTCRYSEIEEPSDTLKALMARCSKK